MKIVGINPTISIITLNISGLNEPIKIQIVREDQKTTTQLIPFATAWMELESIILSEISQTVRDKYHMISPLTGT